MTYDKDLSIVISLFNEEESLPIFYEALCNVINPLQAIYDFEVMFINEGRREK